jgi:hypothetical protein
MAAANIFLYLAREAWFEGLAWRPVVVQPQDAAVDELWDIVD